MLCVKNMDYSPLSNPKTYEDKITINNKISPQVNHYYSLMAVVWAHKATCGLRRVTLKHERVGTPELSQQESCEEYEPTISS